ncbi:hypothetical protein FA95DRAFT_1367216 [Auriscalpium vulgare]|uniref:Uncharacterized protein n=1 Tax=Auriscalpium vulgare TaxID=40419 RepID=A0ACB8R104_9AGAM|nr:hypothetical protein FA95DRAFT_1367216 [Auriscalpium vulgare]
MSLSLLSKCVRTVPAQGDVTQVRRLPEACCGCAMTSRATLCQRQPSALSTSDDLVAMKSFEILISRVKLRSAVPVKDQSSHEDPSQTRAALGTSLAILREINEFSVQVPYIKGAAGVLLRIFLISETLSLCKSQRDELTHNMLPLVAVLREATEYARDHSWLIPPDLHHTLMLWPQELESIEAALTQYNYQRKTWKKLYPLLTHGGARKRMKYCSDRVKYSGFNYPGQRRFRLKFSASRNQ